MGFIDSIKKALQGKNDEAAKALDKAADVIDDKTGGKHTDKIDGAVDKAKDLVDKIDETNDPK